MARQKIITLVPWVCAGLACFASQQLSFGETNAETRLEFLEQRNQALESQVRRQQQLIDALTRDMAEIRLASSNQHQQVEQIKTDLDRDAAAPSPSRFNFGNVHISGAGGIAFFNTGSEGFAPNSEFRVEEARLFVEAPIWDDVFFFSEINLAIRENPGINLNLSELYLDFENVSKLWGRDRQLNVRIGRLNVPFGEEYAIRYAIDNPLISHSVADLWGIDAGIELYGELGRFGYILAVQNGGVQVPAFNGDKTVVGRISYDPNPSLHFSVSGMRTGNRSAANDPLTAIWFGNGFFRSIGANATTFEANLAELDATVRWSGGHASAFAGYVRYDDNDPTADNARDIYYYSVEGVQHITKKFYTAARFSDVIARDGYPLAGHGNFGNYFFGKLTSRLWRLSLGVGYKFSDRLVLKAEYSMERGRDTNGDRRDHEDFFGTQAAFAF